MRYHTKAQITGMLQTIVTNPLSVIPRKSETTMPIISRERQTLRTRRNRTVTANIRALASSGMLNVLGQYVKEFGSDVPAIIASTASPYKFAPAVLGAVASDKVSEDEFDMLTALCDVSGVEIPAPLAGLKGKAVRFDRVCDGSGMKDTVLDMLGI